MFPLIGSGILLGLYILFTYLNKEYVNMLLTVYFLIFGVLAVASTVRPLLFQLLSSMKEDKPTHEFSVTVPFRKDPLQLKWSWTDVFALIVGVGIGVWYAATKHWIANNTLGLAFSIQGVALLSLGSFQIGCILLGGLFVYDVFWVFGTDVMVTVAKSFDAPIKLLWPKDPFAETLHFSMLGLGDIVIPGIFIALMLRLDAKRFNGKKDFPKPYFTFTFGGYVLGMLTTIAVMHIFQAAQPALLYLVPFCIGSSLVCGALLGETTKLVFYSEERTSKKELGHKGKWKKGKGKKKSKPKQPKSPQPQHT